MLKKWNHEFKYERSWQMADRILLAVSGGIDSMVLLHLLLEHSTYTKDQIGVVHINHQLRPESADEERYLKQYCQEKQLAFYTKRWQGTEDTSHVEARARAFRYAFFKEVMEQHKYTVLMTAHHLDDQAETIMMRLTRGSILKNLAGIKTSQPFGSGQLIRPLLIFSKDELKVFAKEQNIVYFEDSSNASDAYFRNRIRHHILPYLKEENDQLLAHFAFFSEQLTAADALIQELLAEKYQNWVTKEQTGWRIDLRELKKESQPFQLFFLERLLQETIIPQGVSIHQNQLSALARLLQQEAPQKMIILEKNWRFIKAYDTAFLTQQLAVQPSVEKSYLLQPGQGIFLSEQEWLGLSDPKHMVTIPEDLEDWPEESCDFTQSLPLPLTIRHRQPGDRLSLTPTLTKRLNRFFIDKKIPTALRNKAWVVSDASDEIIWVPKYVNSYLSIPKETDKIHYRLLYKTREQI